MRHLTTRIALPPSGLSSTAAREFLRLALGEFRWFEPVRFGRASLHLEAGSGDESLDALMAYFEEYKALSVAARTDRDFVLIFTAKPEDPPCTGGLTWQTSVTEARKASWRAHHLEQVASVMRLVGSPYAYSAVAADVEQKGWRLVPAADGLGQEEVFTVRDYGEGLAGLYWRNFLGPPFVRLFGERLATLPEGTRQPLEGGLVLVQPYESPTQAGTPEAQARERELISLLGPECFYDFTHHRPPTRRPSL